MPRILAIELRIGLAAVAVDEMHQRRQAGAGMSRSRRRTQRQGLRIAEDVEEAERRRLSPGARGQAEVRSVVGHVARLVSSGALEHTQQVGRVGGAGQVGQASDDTCRALEDRHVARIACLAGVGQIAPGRGIGIVRRREHRIGQVLLRHHVGRTEDHQVLGIRCAEHRVDRGLRLPRARRRGDRHGAQSLHHRRFVEKDQPASDAALPVRRNQRADRGHNLGETTRAVLGFQRTAVADDDLVVHGSSLRPCAPDLLTVRRSGRRFREFSELPRRSGWTAGTTAAGPRDTAC